MPELKNQYITAKEALKILDVSTTRTLQRYKEKYNIKTKSTGVGKLTLYFKSDIKKCKIEKQSKDKYTNKKVIKKNEDKKIATIQKIDNTKTEIQKNKQSLTNEDFNPLNKIGQDEFIRIEKLLIDKGIIDELDRGILIAYCISYQKYIHAVTQSANNDDTTMDDFGNLKVHPHFTIADKCLTQMNRLAGILGIGVRNRQGLDIKKGKKSSMMAILDE